MKCCTFPPFISYVTRRTYHEAVIFSICLCSSLLSSVHTSWILFQKADLLVGFRNRRFLPSCSVRFVTRCYLPFLWGDPQLNMLERRVLQLAEMKDRSQAREQEKVVRRRLMCSFSPSLSTVVCGGFMFSRLTEYDISF